MARGFRGYRRAAATRTAGNYPHPGPPCGCPACGPAHVRVLGAGHDVRLELGVVEGRGGADKPPVFLAAGIDLELGQAAGQLVARQRAPHLRAIRQAGRSAGPGGCGDVPGTVGGFGGAQGRPVESRGAVGGVPGSGWVPGAVRRPPRPADPAGARLQPQARVLQEECAHVRRRFAHRWAARGAGSSEC